MTERTDGISGPTPSPMRPAPPTRRVVVTERRTRPLRAGVVLAAVGALCFLGGVLTTVVVENAEVFAAVDRANVGNPIRFDAEPRSYSLVFIRGEVDSETFRDRAVRNLECTITAADGATQVVNGSQQTVYSQSALGSSIGTFDAAGGPTTVLCEFLRNPGGILQNYAVAENHATAKIVSWVAIGVGVLLSIVGASLIVIGVRGRAVVTRVPVTPAGRDGDPG